MRFYTCAVGKVEASADPDGNGLRFPPESRYEHIGYGVVMIQTWNLATCQALIAIIGTNLFAARIGVGTPIEDPNP